MLALLFLVLSQQFLGGTAQDVELPGCVSSVYQISEDAALFHGVDIITDSEFPVTLLVNPLGVSSNGKVTLSLVSVADGEIAENVLDQYVTQSYGETWTIQISAPQAANVDFNTASMLSMSSSLLIGLGAALTMTGVWGKRSLALLLVALCLAHMIHAACSATTLGLSVQLPVDFMKTSGSDSQFVSFIKAGPCEGAYSGQPGACSCVDGYSGTIKYVNGLPTGCEANACEAYQVAGSIANEDPGSIVGATGDTVEIACKDGFEGGGVLECGIDGKFTEVFCTGIPCAAVGYKGDDGMCSCAVGFQGTVSYADGAPMGCEGSKCTATQVAGSTAYELDGSIDGTTGNKVTVECKPGYLGGGETTCQESGNWQTVECKAQPCASTFVEFSDHFLADSIAGSTGDSVNVVCNEGYSGSGQATCGSNQVFSTVTCTANACAPTGEFADSDKSGTDVITGTTGQKTYVACNAGFGGSGDVVCQTDGVFSSVSCTAGGCESTTIAHSSSNPIQGSTGQSVSIVCEQGYALSGGSSVTCQPPSGGDTSGKFATGVTCEPTACSATKVANSDHKGTGSITGKTLDTVKVTCDQGYEGGGTVQCTTAGSFTKTLCSPSKCAAAMVDFSDKKDEGSAITGVTGQKVSVTCDTGYTGSGQVECLTTGKFSGLTCTGIPCSGAYEGTPGQCVCASDYVGTVTYTLGGLTSGCTKCPSNSYSPPGNGLACSPIACDEASGYTGTAGQCTCIYGYAGTVVYWNGMTTGCAGIPCSAGYLGEPGQCSCAAGYAGTAGYTAGKPSGCNKCAAGSWSNPGDSTCFGLPCYGAYAGSPGKCTCAAGNSGTVSYNAIELLGCTACPKGKWATAGNGKTCAGISCAVNGYTGTAGACKCDATKKFIGTVEYINGKVSGCYSTGACTKNEFVQDKVCLICPRGTTNPAGDSPTGGNTVCTPTYCTVNKYVRGYRCRQTVLGFTSKAGADCSRGSSKQTSTPCDPYEVPNSNKAAVGAISLKTNQYVSVVCNKGYKGGGFSTCFPSLFYNYTGNHPNGRMSEVKCVKDVAFCPAFGVPNGSPCVAASIGQTCTVTCNSGFTGTTTVTCDGNGASNWGGRPVCRPAAEAACPTGTSASGSGCLEIDGCALDPTICGDPNIVQCVDRPAPNTGYKCQCKKGFIMMEKACRLVWTSAGPLSALDSIRTLYPGDRWEYGIAYAGGDIQNALITTWNQGLRVTLYPFTPLGENHASLTFAATVFTKGLSDAASATTWYHNTFVVNRDSSIASKAGDGAANTVVVYVRPLLRPWKKAGPMIISAAIQSQYHTNRWTYGTLYKNKPTLENTVQGSQPADIQRLYINRWNYGYRHHTFPIQPAGDSLADMSFAHHMWTVNLASSPGGDTLYTYRSVHKFPRYLLFNPPGGDLGNDQLMYVRERTSTFVESSAMGFTNGDTTRYTASYPDARKDVKSHQFAMRYNGEYQVIYTNTWARDNGHRVAVYPPYPHGDSYSGLVFGTAVWTRNATNMYSYSRVLDGVRTKLVTDDPTHWYHWYYRFNNRYSSSYAKDDFRDGSHGGNWDHSCVSTGIRYLEKTGCKRQAVRALVNTWIPTGPLKSFSRSLFPSTTFEYGIETRGGDIRPFLFTGGQQGLRASAYPIMPQGDDGKAMDFGTIVFAKGLADAANANVWYQADFRFPSPILDPTTIRSGEDEVIYIRFHEQTDDAYYNGV